MTSYKLLTFCTVTILSLELIVTICCMLPTFSRVEMRKRCRNELIQKYADTFLPGDLLEFDDLENADFWKVNYVDSSSKCDETKTDISQNVSDIFVCLEGYVWAAPAGYAKNHETMQYSFNLTNCDSETRFSFGTSLFFIGYGLSTLLAGPVADHFGRQKSMLGYGYLMSFVLVSLGFVKNITQYSAFKFTMLILSK